MYQFFTNVRGKHKFCVKPFCVSSLKIILVLEKKNDEISTDGKIY